MEGNSYISPNSTVFGVPNRSQDGMWITIVAVTTSRTYAQQMPNVQDGGQKQAPPHSMCPPNPNHQKILKNEIDEIDKWLHQVDTELDLHNAIVNCIYIWDRGYHTSHLPGMHPLAGARSHSRCPGSYRPPQLFLGTKDMTIINIEFHTKIKPLWGLGKRERRTSSNPIPEFKKSVIQEQNFMHSVQSENRTRVVATTMRNTHHCTN